ncbi:aminotransferase class V-fold PLP-dependent enzyme [Candidatus Gracilibacteria bacterium]|nr:aminotransferase class V-fold PLP-dependent enzyme [Candidatus Gracilibacteria bacterium]
MSKVFLDNAATTKTDPRVVEKMLPFFTENFGNPSGMHAFSRQAKCVLSEARQTVADILNCDPTEIIFTGSGTESDNLAIFGTVEANLSDKKNHLFTSRIEHHAVLYPFEKLKRQGKNVDIISPNQEGEITSEIFTKAIKPNTLFASIALANNEIGTVNDIKGLAKIAQKKEVIFHTDGCQGGGTYDLDVKKLGIDLLTLNGSKISGPKGVGLLFKRKGLRIAPQIIGGAQEWGLRAGTENVAGIVGFAEALRLSQENKETENKRLLTLQQKLIRGLLQIPLTRLNGHPTKRLPNNIHVSFLNTEGESLLLMLDKLGFAVATGSACSTESLEPSHVLTGIGMPHEVAHGSLRITLGKGTTEKNIDNFLKDVPSVVEKVRKMSPVNFTAEDFKEWF